MRLDNIKILCGTFPEQTGHLVEHASFRLCHIDVDVYDSGRDILTWVWPRLARGGIGSVRRLWMSQHWRYHTAGE